MYGETPRECEVPAAIVKQQKANSCERILIAINLYLRPVRSRKSCPHQDRQSRRVTCRPRLDVNRLVEFMGLSRREGSAFNYAEFSDMAELIGGVSTAIQKLRCALVIADIDECWPTNHQRLGSNPILIDCVDPAVDQELVDRE